MIPKEEFLFIKNFIWNYFINEFLREIFDELVILKMINSERNSLKFNVRLSNELKP